MRVIVRDVVSQREGHQDLETSLRTVSAWQTSRQTKHEDEHDLARLVVVTLKLGDDAYHAVEEVTHLGRLEQVLGARSCFVLRAEQDLY